jgi:hypothetical protein
MSSAVVTLSDFSRVRVEVAIPQPEVSRVARAWVEADVDNGGKDEVWGQRTLRAKLDGLSYNTRSGEITYADNRSRVICTRVARSKFLFIRWTSIRKLAACTLVSRFEERRHDNGFDFETRKHLVVELSIVR